MDEVKLRIDYEKRYRHKSVSQNAYYESDDTSTTNGESNEFTS